MAADPMDYIWNKLPKQRKPDGTEYIEYTAADLPYLYHHGFVDTQTYSLDDWLVAIIPFKDETSGTYQLTHAQFLGLGKYRYSGLIRDPFDPMRIREGDWTEENLWKLYHLSIKPSSTLTERQFTLMLEGAKKKGLFANGIFKLDRPFKLRVRQLIDQYPSPLRRLELRIAEEKQSEEKKTLKSQATDFTVGKTEAQKTTKALSELLTKR